MKTSVKQVRQSRFPQAVGLTYNNLPAICGAINECVQRLIIDPRQPETGWWGTWVPMVFNVSRANPYISVPTGIARAMLMDVCKEPIRTQNPFYEYLWTGIGYLPKDCQTCVNLTTQSFFRGNFPIMVDVPSVSYVRIYPTSPSDVGKRVLVQALDANGLKIYSLDGQSQIEGFYMTLQYPFTDSTPSVSSIYGIQKDWTYGDVPISAVDISTAAETQLARYEPGDLNPQYPRYYIDSLPSKCCTTAGGIQVQTLCKLDYRPVTVDSDWVLIGNIPALIDEAQAVYHDGIQETAAAQMSAAKHNNAIQKLQGELDHYMGKESPAVRVALFGTASTRRAQIGQII